MGYDKQNKQLYTPHLEKNEIFYSVYCPSVVVGAVTSLSTTCGRSA
jgi:hypothetical protein